MPGINVIIVIYLFIHKEMYPRTLCNCIGPRDRRPGKMCSFLPDDRREKGNKEYSLQRNVFPRVQYKYIGVTRFIKITICMSRYNDLLPDDLH